MKSAVFLLLLAVSLGSSTRVVSREAQKKTPSKFRGLFDFFSSSAGREDPLGPEQQPFLPQPQPNIVTFSNPQPISQSTYYNPQQYTQGQAIFQPVTQPLALNQPAAIISPCGYGTTPAPVIALLCPGQYLPSTFPTPTPEQAAAIANSNANTLAQGGPGGNAIANSNANAIALPGAPGANAVANSNANAIALPGAPGANAVANSNANAIALPGVPAPSQPVVGPEQPILSQPYVTQPVIPQQGGNQPLLVGPSESKVTEPMPFGQPPIVPLPEPTGTIVQPAPGVLGQPFSPTDESSMPDTVQPQPNRPPFRPEYPQEPSLGTAGPENVFPEEEPAGPLVGPPLTPEPAGGMYEPLNTVEEPYPNVSPEEVGPSGEALGPEPILPGPLPGPLPSPGGMAIAPGPIFHEPIPVAHFPMPSPSESLPQPQQLQPQLPPPVSFMPYVPHRQVCHPQYPFLPPGFSFVNPSIVGDSEHCPLYPRPGFPPCSTLEYMEKLQLRTIYRLIITSGLDTLFAQTTNYTFFAPADPAFLKLPEWFLASLEADLKLLRAFILQHFIKIDLPLYTVGNDFLVMNARPGGNRLRFNTYFEQNSYRVVTVDGAQVLLGDIQTRQGRLNILNEVLSPNPIRNIAQYLQEVPDFSAFMTAVAQSSNVGMFQSDEPMTVFIPFNEAFERFNLGSISMNGTALSNFVRYHVVPGTFYSNGLVDGQYLPTMYNKEIKLSVSTDGYSKTLTFVNNNVRVLKADIPLLNGVAHVIDSALSTLEEFYIFQGLNEFSLYEFGTMKRNMIVGSKEA